MNMVKDDKSLKSNKSYPLSAWFLGPRAENGDILSEYLNQILSDYIHWRKNYFPSDPVVVTRVRKRSDLHQSWLDFLSSNLDKTLNDLKQHYPFHSPRYIAHMLSELSLPSILGYFAGMLYNPNNVTDEAAPITVKLEVEVGKMIAEMLGYNPNRSWTHICSGGTIANIEALWIARTAKFLPFTVREFCEINDINFQIKTANGKTSLIRELSNEDLISIRPNESIFMLRKLVQFINITSKRNISDIINDINGFFLKCKYNIAKNGLTKILSSIKINGEIAEPIIFVSASAHYSIKKAANVLGYGENSIISVPVTSRFKLDMNYFRRYVNNLKPHQYIAAVIGIVGTTEEGAIDPIHELKFFRDKLQKNKNKSFWLHIDAAWGGYFRCLFNGVNVPRAPKGSKLDAICDLYIRALDIEEKFHMSLNRDKKCEKSVEIRWNVKDNYSAFLAFPDADSITIDPHKMGFVPYPAGVVSFRNGLVTELIQQKAQYISDESGGLKNLDELIDIDAVGPYILEGSKPGAAAMACWLAHKSIPLTISGHGKIVRTSLLNTQKLFRYLVNHRHMFDKIHYEATREEYCSHPFTFIPLFEPDTNLVCFIIHPMERTSGNFILVDFPLHRLNELNKLIYSKGSLSSNDEGGNLSSSQPYYVSRTRFENEQYSAKSLKKILELINISVSEYKKEGIFVLRSTVMNPWYYEAQNAGLDYLYDYVVFLHKIANEAYNCL
jgi:glutamate/tyrosine decarboxylase-like PLP-dependent enzyme